MNKRDLIHQFEKQIAADLAILTQAALAAHDAATHSESKAEDQYDTRGLEASYLAGAQSKRALELEGLLALYRHIDILTFAPNAPIAATAVVELDSDGKRTYYLLMPKGGGMSTEYVGKLIQVVSPQSPLGSALLGHRVGDQIEVAIQRVVKDYEIICVE
jgi:transcription elongation GreA/GreB family factor